MSTHITDCLQDMIAAFPHFRPADPERTVDVYERSLSDLEEYQLRPAVDHLIKAGGRFFPTVSEIRETVRRLNPQAPRRPWVAIVQDLYNQAVAGDFDEQAWRQVIAELRTAGRLALAGAAEQKLAALLAGPDPDAGDRHNRDLDWIRKFQEREPEKA